jgi:hypothetical protein
MYVQRPDNGHLGGKMSDANNDPHDPSIGSDLGTDSLVLR